jgi:hypothetical protein
VVDDVVVMEVVVGRIISSLSSGVVEVSVDIVVVWVAILSGFGVFKVEVVVVTPDGTEVVEDIFFVVVSLLVVCVVDDSELVGPDKLLSMLVVVVGWWVIVVGSVAGCVVVADVVVG